MDAEFVVMMKEFIKASLADREENKEVRDETRKCLTKIKIQLTKLETSSVIDERINEERRTDCKTIHKEIDTKLDTIPTQKEKENIEDRIIDLEKLKPFIYKLMGIVAALGVIAVPILKKMGIL